jgi:hypothetical protein
MVSGNGRTLSVLFFVMLVRLSRAPPNAWRIRRGGRR